MGMTEPQDIATLPISEWYKRFAYIVDDDGYFDVLTQREISRKAFNAIYRGVQCFSVHNAGRRIEAATAFDESRAALGSRVVQSMTFAPGDGVLVAKADGTVYANRWRNARPKPVSGDVSPWLAHAERMLPDPMERNHVLNVMAYKVQHPARKINHAVLHCGMPGSGKDSLWAPFFWAVGGDNLGNVYAGRADDVTGDWGYGLESEVLILNELRQTNHFDRKQLENDLKPMIAAPPEYLMVNRKGLHPYPALNRLLVVAFSNERIPIALSADDRRWFVVWSTALRMTDEEGVSLWGWYKQGGMAKVAGYLHERDVSAFNPGATPPMTIAKTSLIDLSLSSAELLFRGMIHSRIGPFARGIVGSPWGDVIRSCGGATVRADHKTREALFNALAAAGWRDMGKCMARGHMAPRTIWCAPEHYFLTATELRVMLESPPELSLVK